MATRVTAATGGRLKSAGPYEVIVNFPELVACILLPMAILIRNRLLTFRVFLLFACVGVGSVLLMNQSAQLRILALPFALLFIALRLIEDGAEHAAEPSGRVRLGFANQAMQGLILVVWFLYCYPLAVNIPLSFVKSLHGPVAVPGAGLLGELRVERRAEPEALAFDPMDTSLPPEEIYERAINSRQVNSADVLSAQQYVASLADGVRAVQDACGPSPRVLTADFVIPFPAVLDLPVGGGMIFIHPGLLVSQQDHPVAERLFRDVTCVMIPKLPVVQRARPFVLGVYADYLGKHFEEVKRTAYWTVLRSKTP
jgi:hypothetical protein